MWFFVQLCSGLQDFNWLKGSRGLSAAAELLVPFPFTTRPSHYLLTYIIYPLFTHCVVACLTGTWDCLWGWLLAPPYFMSEVITKCHSLPLLQCPSVISHVSVLVCAYFLTYCLKIAVNLCAKRLFTLCWQYLHHLGTLFFCISFAIVSLLLPSFLF